MVTIDYLDGPFPSVFEYRSALEAIRYQVTPNQIRLLMAHFAAKNHIATARQLAQSVGFKSSNLQYGKFASALCKALGKKVNSDDVYILLRTDTPKIKGVDRPLTMRPEVVQAIEELGWK